MAAFAPRRARALGFAVLAIALTALASVLSSCVELGFVGSVGLRGGAATRSLATQQRAGLGAMEELMKDPEKMKEVQASVEELMKDPEKKKAVEEWQRKAQEGVEKLRQDPEMKAFFEDVEKNGFEALKNWEGNEEVLRKFSAATGGPAAMMGGMGGMGPRGPMMGNPQMMGMMGKGGANMGGAPGGKGAQGGMMGMQPGMGMMRPQQMQGMARPQAQQTAAPTGGAGLSAAALAAAPATVQKQMIGEKLFPAISKIQPELAGKITGMMLEMDNSELLILLESEQQLKNKVDEALRVLETSK
mmetsp:Transcript_42349/g.92247  ORF Transcript_42349/g.92247 Transcript_42349/m.92247 type:complete len:302 (-) Transcript_42349:85-990(-)